MSTKEIEQEILKRIRDLYSADFTGYLAVIKDNNSYTLKIGLPTYLEATGISADCDTDEDFISFVIEEFRKRNYMRVYIYKVIRENNGNWER